MRLSCFVISFFCIWNRTWQILLSRKLKFQVLQYGKHLRRMLVSLLYIYIFVVIRDLWGPVPHLLYMHREGRWNNSNDFIFSDQNAKLYTFLYVTLLHFHVLKNKTETKTVEFWKIMQWWLQFKLMFNSPDRKHKWVFWSPVVNLFVCKVFTFSSSSSKVQKFQLNLAQNILGEEV